MFAGNDIFGDFGGAKNYNECLDKCFFPDELKFGVAVPVYKKNDKKDKNNYRPVSILSNISKLHEKCMHQQINEYFESLLTAYLTVY